MKTRILLGGIPLGCDNIGDEAIIACVVSMLKRSLPESTLAVATKDPETAARLGVATVPAFGFADTPLDGFRDTVEKFDAYIWCGATGLSDYPHVALDLLEIAQNAGVSTYVWGVGMDDELNPVFFRTRGRRRALLRLLGLNAAYERRLERRLAARIGRILPRCRGIWLRDPQSAARLASLGFADAKIAADTAILQGPDGPLPAPAAALVETPSAPPRRLGLCISTQRQVADLDGLKRMLANLAASGIEVLGIPMNPKTDRVLLDSLGVHCIDGTSPEAVVQAAATCGVILSSRLHLLILAANVGIPILGIARGSKLANWLSNFGLGTEGSVTDCDWEKTERHVIAALDRESIWAKWPENRTAAYERLAERLSAARGDFIARIKGEPPADWPRVTVLVRARNDEALIGKTLSSIFSQYPPPSEVIVCDDGSTDRTREIAAGFPVRFVERPQGRYMPGVTLNNLVRCANGDVVVFNNSDAVPLDSAWLHNLVAPLLAPGGRAAIAFANQLPRKDASMLVRKDSERAFGDGSVHATWRFFFSLASSATWRDLLIATPFDESLRYSEDVAWAWRNSRRKKDPVRIVYCPDAHVEHSHNYTLRELARRFRGEGTADAAIFGDKPCFARELAGALRETLRDFRYLLPCPRGWVEVPMAPVRRLVQRISHWRGLKDYATQQ